MQVSGCRIQKNIRRSKKNMASENYLEEALNAKVDETAVNAIMKTLEIQLNSTSSLPVQQENPLTLLNHPEHIASEITSSIQKCDVINNVYSASENPAEETRIPSVMTFSKTLHCNDQSVIIPGLSPTANDTQMGSCITNSKVVQSDESSGKMSENFKTSFFTGTKVSNRPVFQPRSLPSTNTSFPLFGPQPVLQATIAEKDAIKAHVQSTSPVMVNVGSLPSVENKSENETLMLKCPTTTRSSSDSPLLMNLVTVPISAHNSGKIPDTHAMTFNTSRTVGRVAVPKAVAPSASVQQTEGNNTNTILSNNVQVVNVIPLKPGTPNKQSQKNLVQRMMIGAPQLIGNRMGPQVKMTVQPPQGQDGKHSPGHLLLKNQNGQYQWVRVNLATSRPGPNMASTTSTSCPGQNIVFNKVSASDFTVSGQFPAHQNVKVQSIPTDLVTKEKCQAFLAKILEMANSKTANVKKNIYNLTQDLIDGKVDVEYYSRYLEVFLNTPTQFSFTEFFRKSLPLIRHSLATKELVLDGIRPPPYYVCLSASNPVAVVPHMQSPVTNSAVASSQQNILIQPSPETSSNFASRELFWQPSTQLQAKIAPNANKTQSVTLVNVMEPSNSTKNVAVVNTGSFGQSLIRPRTSTIKPIVLPAQPSLSTTDFQQVPVPISVSNVHQLSPVPVQMCPTTTETSEDETYRQTKSENPQVDVTLPPKESFTSGTLKPTIKHIKNNFYSFMDFATEDMDNVTTLCGDDLQEETQNTLTLGNYNSTQNKKCQEETFLNIKVLQKKIKHLALSQGLAEPSLQVATLISQACEEKIKSLLEKLSVISAHRTTKLNMNATHEVFRDVKSQLKFLEEVDQARKRHHEENECKYDINGHSKFKGKHKRALRAEMVELRQQEANQTALQAIGFRKKTKFGNEVNSSGLVGNCISAIDSTKGCFMVRTWPYIKRVTMQDMIFLLEQEKQTCRSVILYKAHFKR